MFATHVAPLSMRIGQGIVWMIPGLIAAAFFLFFGIKRLSRYLYFKRNSVEKTVTIEQIEQTRIAFNVRHADAGLDTDERLKVSKKTCPTELHCVDESGKKSVYSVYGNLPDWARKGNAFTLHYLPQEPSQYRLPDQRANIAPFVKCFIWAAVILFFTISTFLTSTFFYTPLIFN